MRPWAPLLCVVGMLHVAASAASAGEAVDLLLRGGTVVTMDSAFRVLEDGAVAVKGERIVAVGPARELAARFAPARTIDAAGRIVMPGLVNTHTHVPMTLFRGVADDVELMVWLTEVHLAGGSPSRHARVRDVGHAPRGLGDDPHRHHHLRRHVLLRGPGGGGRESGRPARVLRGDRAGPESARARERRRGAARRGGVPEEVVGRPADPAGRRAARRLHGEPRDVAARQDACRPLQGTAHDPRGGEPERDADDPGEVRDDHRRPPRQDRLPRADGHAQPRDLAERRGDRDPRRARRGHRALPLEQHEARERRLAGAEAAQGGRAGRPRQRRPGEQQRPEPVRGGRSRAQAAEDHERRPRGAQRARRRRDGHDRRRTSAPHGQGDRLAGTRQARRPDRARERRAVGAAALRRLLAPRLRAQGLGRA